MADTERTVILELWERHTGLTVSLSISALPHGSASPYTAAFFRQGSRSNLTMVIGAYAKQINEWNEAQKLREALPLQPGDTHWLLHKFLQVEYPQGGTTVGTSQQNCSPRSSVWSKLEQFVQRPEYSHHPNLANLREVIETAHEPRSTPGCNQALKVALQMLRPPYPETRASKGGHRTIEYHVGAQAPSNVVAASTSL